MASIKTVQSGTASFTASDTTITATITAIVTAKSFLMFSLSGTNSTEYVDNIVRGTITNTTTLTFKRQYARLTVQVEWFLIEFSSGVTTQQIYQSDVQTTSNVTITSINTSKSFSLCSHLIYSVVLRDSEIVSNYIQSATNLRLERTACGDQIDTDCQVIEYDNATVQQVSKALASGDTSNTSTITAVTLAQTFTLFSYKATSSAASGEPRNYWISELTNTTTITYTRNTSSQAHTTRDYVISISDSIAVQRGKKSFTSTDTSLTQTISAVILAKSSIHCLNHEGIVQSNEDGGDCYRMDVHGIKLKYNSTTQISLVRNATNSKTAIVSWEAIQWYQSSRIFDFAPFFALH